MTFEFIHFNISYVVEVTVACVIFINHLISCFIKLVSEESCGGEGGGATLVNPAPRCHGAFYKV